MAPVRRAACLLAGLSPLALACPPPTVIIDGSGQAHYAVTDADEAAAVRDEATALLGAPPNADDVVFYDRRDRRIAWVPRDRLEYFRRQSGAGGDGFVYVGPDGCAPRNLPIQLPEGPPRPPTPLPDGRGPIELFPGAIQPAPGLWRAQLGKTELQGCPAVVAQAFPKSPGALPAAWLQPRRLDFRSPFHPDQLQLSQTLSAQGQSPVRWRKTGDQRWVTEAMAPVFGQIPAGLGGGSQMSWQLTLRSATEFEHVTTVRIALPAAAAAVMGGGADCRLTSVNRWLRVGD